MSAAGAVTLPADGPGADRRESPRIAVELGCKVRPSATTRFLAAQTCNLSRRGALVRVSGSPLLGVGDPVEVGIGFNRGGLLAAGEMVPGRVVRATGRLDGRQDLAIAFEQVIPAADRLVQTTVSATPARSAGRAAA